MTRIFLLIFTVVLMTSCARDSTLRGHGSLVTFGLNYSYQPGQAVALLPLVNSERKSVNDLITSRFAANLTSIGFSVLSPEKVKQAAAKAKINLANIPSDTQLASLGKSLGVRIIIVGTYSCLQNATADSEEAIATIKKQLSQIERKAYGDISLMQFTSYYIWLAAAMLLLLLLEFIIPVTKKNLAI